MLRLRPSAYNYFSPPCQDSHGAQTNPALWRAESLARDQAELYHDVVTQDGRKGPHRAKVSHHCFLLSIDADE